MSADPISCALLAAASLSTGLRRIAGNSATATTDIPIDPLGAAVASARQRARMLHIPESAISSQLETARRRGQSDLSALNELLERAGRGKSRG